MWHMPSTARGGHSSTRLNENLAPDPATLAHKVAVAQKFANATPNDTGNHGAHYDSIKNGELTAVFVELGESPKGYRHSMFGEERLGCPIIAGS